MKMKTAETKPFGMSEKLARAIGQLVASNAALYFKVKKAHWTASGPHFKHWHEMLDEQASMILGYIDPLAERLVTFGRVPAGSLAEYQKDSAVEDAPAGKQSPRAMLENLYGDYLLLCKLYRQGIDHAQDDQDPGTADLLTQQIQGFEKMAWFLRETIQKEEE